MTRYCSRLVLNHITTLLNDLRHPPGHALHQRIQEKPLLIFNSVDRKRGKRGGGVGKQPKHQQQKQQQQQQQQLQHSHPVQNTEKVEEHRRIVSFLSQSWSEVSKEIQTDGGSVEYLEESDNPDLRNFEPFDLDVWMEEALFNAVMASV